MATRVCRFLCQRFSFAAALSPALGLGAQSRNSTCLDQTRHGRERRISPLTVVCGSSMARGAWCARVSHQLPGSDRPWRQQEVPLEAQIGVAMALEARGFGANWLAAAR